MQATYMLNALEEAKKSYDNNEVPIGAVIVDSISGEIICRTGNIMECSLDPTCHAEINAIRAACKIKNSVRLPQCDLYVTLEPCPMCAQAISFARIRRVYFGAYDPKGGGVEHGAKIFSASSCHHKPEVYGGIMEKECGAILQDFFVKKR
jgi:tRNA(Arg) A34 adenosine deaminase TadA